MAPPPHQNRSRAGLCGLLPALAAAAIGCQVSPPVILPPPFGPNGAQPVRLFFPTGIAAAPSGQLLVNNANFDRSFDSGTMIALSKDFVDSQFTATPQTLAAGLTGAVLISDFAGPIALDPSGTVAYTGSRDSNLVTAVQLDPASGGLTCVTSVPNGGPDCRRGLVNTVDAWIAGTQTPTWLEGPYGLVAGTARVPGDSTERPVMFVSSLVPHVDSILSGILQTFGRVAALDLSSPGSVLFTVAASSPTLSLGIGAGPVLFDGARRQLILGGCYQRFSSSAAGQPTTNKCGVTLGTNPIRFIDVDSGADGVVRVFDLQASVKGNETSALVLGGEDANGVPQTLYALARNPDVLVELSLPPVLGQDPIVRRVTPMPLSPSGAIRLARPAGQPGPDLLAIAGSVNDSLTLFDTASGQVAAQVPVPGDYPFQLVQLPSSGTSARMVATVFGTCSLAFFEVDLAQPQNLALKSVVGKCGP